MEAGTATGMDTSTAISTGTAARGTMANDAGTPITPLIHGEEPAARDAVAVHLAAPVGSGSSRF